MELDELFDPQTLIVGLGLWLVVVLMIWKMSFVESEFYTFGVKMGVTLVMLPVVFVVLLLMKSR